MKFFLISSSSLFLLFLSIIITAEGRGPLANILLTFTELEKDQQPADVQSMAIAPLKPQSTGGAIPMKNEVKGPNDLGIYYINSAGKSCGGLTTSLCSHNCGAVGYPVYWCYPKVCYCHYGSKPLEQEMESNDILEY